VISQTAQIFNLIKRILIAMSGQLRILGSKVSTKLTILKSLAGKVDQLVVAAGIANTFLLAMGLPAGERRRRQKTCTVWCAATQN